MSKSDEEIYKECEEVWKKVNSWGLSYYELIRLSHQNGPDGNGRRNGMDNSPDDIVYIHPEGYELTRYVCDNWIAHWRTFSHGWIAAYRFYVEKKE